jgi:AcrR family transcriptional regulator
MEIDYGNKILNAAIELFKSRGIVSVTMDDIAHKVGASKRTIYQTFRSKDEIISAIATIFFENQKKSYEDIRNAGNAIEELFLLLIHFQDLFETLHPRILYEIQKYYPDIWTMTLQHKNDNLLERVKQNLMRGIREKLYRADIDIEFTAKLRLEQIELAYNPFHFPQSKYPPNKVTEQLVSLYVFGLVTTEAHKKYLKKFHFNY